ncbi:MAG TPA: response regulator transcription factor [Cytophagaceae bacterium]|jgi:DNA-binding NarL/FixJ family response regulator|nr:response regulator transcription factor [Cytophagaceae bacterium]
MNGNMEKIKIILADDHILVREGFKSLLGRKKEFEVVGEAENGKELLRLIEHLSADVLLVDISMPQLNGIEAIAQMKKINPNLKFIMLTMHEEAEYILKSIQAGANGYLLKNVEPDELENAIKTVAAGGKYFNAAISNIMIESISKGQDQSKEEHSEITAREKEILQYVADGLSTKLIADKLSISTRTVETHRVHIMKKLQVSNGAEMVKKGLEQKIIK